MIKYKSFSTISTSATKSGLLFDMDVIKEDVLSIILTRKGDYPQDVTKGCIIHDYLFNPSVNTDEIAEIKEDMLQQLSSDPRLSNIDIYIQSSEDSILVAIYADVVGIDDRLIMNVQIKE